MPDDGGSQSPGVVINLGNSGGNQSVSPNGSQNSGAAANQGGTDFLSVFSNEDNRKYTEQKGWKDADALLKSYRDLEVAYSKKSGQPGQANGQQAANVSERVVPTTPAEYEFQVPDGVPADIYDKNLASMFQGWSHKAKLSKSEAQAIHDGFVGHMAQTLSQAKAQQAQKFGEAVNGTFAALTKEWGNPGTPGFDRAIEMGRRAIANLEPGLKEALSQHGVIGKDAKGNEVVLNAPIFKALSKVGGRMFAEDNVFGAPAASDNPFDPKKADATKAGELIRKNPELARSLIMAAGPEAQKDWSWWLDRK